MIYIFQGFYRFRFLLQKYFFSFSLTNSLGYVKRMLYSEQPTVLLVRRYLHNTFDQFWKFKFHFQNISRSTRFLSFDGPTNYLCLFKNHRQTFPWPGKRPSSHLKVTKKWFVTNIKYLSESFFAYFSCREGISCLIFSIRTGHFIKLMRWKRKRGQ